MTAYTRTRRSYLLEVIEENGSFTCLLTNLVTGATCRNAGWSSRFIALQVVQEMYEQPTI